MLTSFQVAIGAYYTEDGEFLCVDCFERGDNYARPVSNYELDEQQSAFAEDHEWDDDGLDHTECEPALYDEHGHELREEYHYGHEEEASNA